MQKRVNCQRNRERGHIVWDTCFHAATGASGPRYLHHLDSGYLGAGAISAAMVPLGFTAAMVDMARQVTHADYAPQFLAEEFQDILAFAACTVAGIVTRKNRAEHARFMVLAAVALLDVGPGRIASNIIGAMPTGPLGVWAQYYWGTALILMAMLAWDLLKHGRVMRSVALGAALLWGGEAIASILYFSPAWKLAAGGLVKAWGWAG